MQLSAEIFSLLPKFISFARLAVLPYRSAPHFAPGGHVRFNIRDHSYRHEGHGLLIQVRDLVDS